MTADTPKEQQATPIIYLPDPDRRIDASVHGKFRDFVLDLNSGPIAAGIPVPRYSTSLDAVIDLVQDLLPGWTWSVRVDSLSYNVQLIPNDVHSNPAAEASDARNRIDRDAGLNVDFAPQPRGAMGLLACLIEILGAHEAGCRPDPDVPFARQFFTQAIEARALPYRQGA